MANRALIYDAQNTLVIVKETGLRIVYQNVDKPELGFEYEGLVYDQDEFKILEVNPSNWDASEKHPLTDSERDKIEKFIDDAEAPDGTNLNNQYIDDLYDVVAKNIYQLCIEMRIENLYEATYIGREDSNHPYRSDARRVLEFADSSYSILEQVVGTITRTREDQLKDFDDYCDDLLQLPRVEQFQGQQ